MPVVWTAPALRQLEEIQDYIAADDPLAAFRVAQVIRSRVNDDLSEHPNLGRPGRVSNTRELVIAGTPYIVAYRVRGEEVEILAIKHGAQRWPRNL